MKRLLAILLALVMMLALAACAEDNGAVTTGGSIQGSTPQTSEQPPQTTAAVETTAPAVFEEIVVVDDENCTIRITGIDPDNMWGYTLKVYLENKSADKTYMFSISSASINGVDTDPLFATEVAAGKKSNESITFSTDVLEDNGVGDFTDIALNFRVYDSNDWMADDIAQVSAHVYPYGEANATRFTREAQPGDTVLVDNEYATVIVTGYENDEIWGYTANLFIVNKTDVPVMVSVDESSVNGYMIDPFFADSVSAGNCAFSSISWSDTELQDNGITDVESIEFVLRVYNETDWMADDFVNETITLKP